MLNEAIECNEPLSHCTNVFLFKVIITIGMAKFQKQNLCIIIVYVTDL